MYGKHIKKKLLFFIFALVFLLYVLDVREIGIFSYFRDRRKDFIPELYIINTTGCRIPYLNIYDEEIMHLLSKPRNFMCDYMPPLVYSNLTSLVLNSSVLEVYGIKDLSKVHCSYEPFWRVDPKGNESDHEIKYGKPKYFNISINVDEEFARVTCKYGGKTYKDFHSFVPMKASLLNQYKIDTKRSNDERLNIIMVGIDSVSRLHFHRKMPRTLKYLLDDLKAIEYMGYNKLADNTFPNLMPIFTGYSFPELIKGCWPSYSTKFDNCSFVFQNYSKEGYVTSFAEEKTVFGVFNYLKTGWIKQPTDYYFKTFEHTAVEELGHYYDILRTYPTCVGPRPMYEVMLDYSEKFYTTMKDKRFFHFCWATSISHDNYDTVTLGEDKYIEHLSFLKESGILNNSMLIFLSDHGYRFGKMPRTHQGHLEERLPFIYFVLPPWFHNKYPMAMENMKNNAFRLTTPFDIHATLKHILHPSELVDEKLVDKEVPDQRSVSLFHPIPEGRTCDSADIPSHYCTCQESIPVEMDDPVVVRVAEYTVEYINEQLKSFEGCFELELGEITTASLAKYGDVKNNAQRTTSDYSVSFKTLPGGAWFDTTVRCTYCERNDFIITGSISRLNRYGNQSYCIDDFNLKLYCYCKEQPESV